MVTQDELKGIKQLFSSNDYDNHVLAYTIANSLGMSDRDIVELLLNKVDGFEVEIGFTNKNDLMYIEYCKELFNYDFAICLFDDRDIQDQILFMDILCEPKDGDMYDILTEQFTKQINRILKNEKD